MIQVRNPRTKKYIRIDTDKGRIIDDIGKDTPYDNIPIKIKRGN